MSDVFLRVPDVVARVGLSRATIYSMAARGAFPKPIRIGQRASAWSASEVDAWQAARRAEPRAQPRRVIR